MSKQDQVSFDVSESDRALINSIAMRAAKLARKHGHKPDLMSIKMDLMATHANGNPLRLMGLHEADDFNLLHDVFGIARHLDRDTGNLMNCFRPRFSVPEPFGK